MRKGAAGPAPCGCGQQPALCPYVLGSHRDSLCDLMSFTVEQLPLLLCGMWSPGAARGDQLGDCQRTTRGTTATRLVAVDLEEGLKPAVFGGRLSARGIQESQLSPRVSGLAQGAMAPQRASPRWESQALRRVSLTLHGTYSFHHFSWPASLKAIFVLCLNYLSLYIYMLLGLKS